MRLALPRSSPVAVELEISRRRRLRAQRRTYALGVASLVAAGVVVAGELGRVWRRVPRPSGHVEDVLEVAGGTVGQALEVAVAGYQTGSRLENSLLNLLVSFSIAFGVARASTHAIRRRGTFGPFRNINAGRSHIHHFVPGIAMAFVAGGIAILTRDERLDPVLAVPFGVGVALTLDESALLLRLDDVYWTEEGIVSVQITFTAMLMVSALALVLRLLRRGEAEVLGDEHMTGQLFNPDELRSAA